MALCKKVRDSDTGATISYWKIVYYDLDIMAGYCKVVLHGWKDKKARDSLKRPLKSYTYVFTKDQFSFDLSYNLLPQLYSKIKSFYSEISGSELSKFYIDFSDAEDC